MGRVRLLIVGKLSQNIWNVAEVKMVEISADWSAWLKRGMEWIFLWSSQKQTGRNRESPAGGACALNENLHFKRQTGWTTKWTIKIWVWMFSFWIPEIHYSDMSRSVVIHLKNVRNFIFHLAETLFCCNYRVTQHNKRHGRDVMWLSLTNKSTRDYVCVF